MVANRAIPSGDYLLKRILYLENLMGINGAGNALFSVADANGIRRVQVGALANGDYGILLRDLLGNVQELLPLKSSFYNSQLSVSSTSPTTVANSPSVTVDIGASGDAILSLGANISSNSAGVGGLVYPLIDGALTPVAGNTWLLYNNYTGNVSCFVEVQVSQFFGHTLTPGSHTFTLKYSTALSGTAIFTANVLKVQPI